jgi:hypothetical protein
VNAELRYGSSGKSVVIVLRDGRQGEASAVAFIGPNEPRLKTHFRGTFNLSAAERSWNEKISVSLFRKLMFSMPSRLH